MRYFRFALPILVCSATIGLAFAQDAGEHPAATAGPQQGGLATLYASDEGIERDPRVLFVEDFETGTVEEVGAR